MMIEACFLHFLYDKIIPDFYAIFKMIFKMFIETFA